MQCINTQLVTSIYLKATKTGGASLWVKNQERMSENVNRDCPEPPTARLGRH